MIRRILLSREPTVESMKESDLMITRVMGELVRQNQPLTQTRVCEGLVTKGTNAGTARKNVSDFIKRNPDYEAIVTAETDERATELENTLREALTSAQKRGVTRPKIDDVWKDAGFPSLVSAKMFLHRHPTRLENLWTREMDLLLTRELQLRIAACGAQNSTEQLKRMHEMFNVERHAVHVYIQQHPELHDLIIGH